MYWIYSIKVLNEKEKINMQEISKEKKKFLESIGIDINNLPPEFARHSDTMESTFSEEEIAFLNRENLTGRYI